MDRTRKPAPAGDFVYHFAGRLHTIKPIGPVADGIRMHSHFGGRVTAGELTGAEVEGVDYFRVRYDGIGVIDGRELITFEGKSITVALAGYVLPPEGVPAPTREQLTSPDFTWPDVPFRIEALATFFTAAPDLAHLNAVAVTHTGTVNMATGELHIEARRFPAYTAVGAPTGALAGTGS